MQSVRRPWYVVLFVALAALVLAGIWGDRRVAGSLLPHGWCFTWSVPLLSLHVVSDLLIGLAYVSIPLTLLHVVRRRDDLPFNWIFMLFALFILSCGTAHFLEVWTVWRPNYWLLGGVKAITAGASLATAIALVGLVPRVLALPTLSQLQSTRDTLETEVRQRRLAEEQLREERESLAQRVDERTRELAEAKLMAEAASSEAEAANVMKDQFLARVSHELRTPLQALLGWVQVLGHEGLEPTRMRHAIDRIRHNVDVQARLIDDLLDVARILSGKLRLEMRPLEPAEVIARAVEMVRPRADAQRVRIDLELHLAGVTLTGDPARLQQVVWNLLSNAVQASTAGGRILVEARVEAARLVIAVRDWGKGIAARDLPYIFEPFRQGGDGPGGHGGLGLGLAITHSIIGEFGGEVRADSAGPGLGATFTVTLPMLRPSGLGAGAGADGRLSPGEREALQGVHVLYVEDEPDIADPVCLMLAELGLSVRLCRRYDEAADQVRRGGFDVLLSDLRLDGGRTGHELVRLLHAQPDAAGIPAIAMSSLGSDEDRRASAAAGFVMHLVKPFDVQRLGRAIAGVVMAARAVR